MAKIILISGPIKSGKTTYAEELAQVSGHEKIVYLATQGKAYMDEGMAWRIERHQANRPSHWQTIEAYQDLPAIIEKTDFEGMIIDDLVVWATNLFFDEWATYKKPADLTDIDGALAQFDRTDMGYFRDFLLKEAGALIQSMKASEKDFWVITHELGWTLTPAHRLGSLFVDYVGMINQGLAAHADEAYVLVMGLPQQVKGP